MSYIICIPSYKRAAICNEKTLAMLKKNNIPKDKIYVYVANKEEYDEYKKVLDPSFYHKLVIGKKGIVPQRKFITDSWPNGKQIISFDDDVKMVDLKMAGYKSLDAFFKDAFQECEKQKAYIWGVYPVYNPFFRKGQQKITTCLNFIVGAFYGYINRPKLHKIEPILTREIGQKEDVEQTIRYFINDGIVLRFNRVGFVTKYYGSSGGLGTFEERMKPMLEAATILKKHFPEYGDIRKRKTGMAEFRLKKIPSKMDVSENDKNNQNAQKTRKRTNLSKRRKTLRK